MISISQSGTTGESSSFPSVEWDEYIPLVTFEKSSFTRPEEVRLLKDDKKVTLSGRIDEDKRSQDWYCFTMLPGKYTLPFRVSEGCGTWDEDGILEARIHPATAGVKILSGVKEKRAHGDTFDIDLEITGHLTRSFSIQFFANDDTDDNNTGEYKDIFCGRVDVAVAGSSQVGFRLIDNIDALQDAPPGYIAPEWDTKVTSQITLSQKQANMYNNCEGVCYATSASRAQKAYLDVKGVAIIDLTVSNQNIDHKIASTQGGNVPFMGFGAGGPFARHGYGQVVDNAGVWKGDLRRGALLQRWRSKDPDNLFGNGGHSVIFRNYLYDDLGAISAVEYTDYHGGKRPWLKLVVETWETLLGVNLLDSKL